MADSKMPLNTLEDKEVWIFAQERQVKKVMVVPIPRLATLYSLSGWRLLDVRRVKEIRGELLAGRWRQNVGGNISILDKTDPDENYIIDDGLQTAYCLKDELFPAWEADKSMDPEEKPWDPKLVELFTDGVSVDVVEYKDDSRESRIEVQADRHDETSNKFRFTAVYTLAQVATNAIKRHGSRVAAQKHLTSKLGSSKESSIKRWLRFGECLTPEQLVIMQEMKLLKTGYLNDNVYFLGVGVHTKERMTPETSLVALSYLKEEMDDKEDGEPETTTKEYKTIICKNYKFLEVWHKLICKRFGDVARNSMALKRLYAHLQTRGGLRKVAACTKSGMTLHGTSDENPGIVECRVLVKEFEKCLAGSDPPAPSEGNPDGSGAAVQAGGASGPGVSGPSCSTTEAPDKDELMIASCLRDGDAAPTMPQEDAIAVG